MADYDNQARAASPLAGVAGSTPIDQGLRAYMLKVYN